MMDRNVQKEGKRKRIYNEKGKMKREINIKCH